MHAGVLRHRHACGTWGSVRCDRVAAGLAL